MFSRQLAIFYDVIQNFNQFKKNKIHSKLPIQHALNLSQISKNAKVNLGGKNLKHFLNGQQLGPFIKR